MFDIHHSHRTCNKSKHAKNNILRKLKEHVAGADYSKLPQEVSYNYPALDIQEQVTQFTNNLEANQAKVIRVTRNDIPQVISQQLNQRGISSLLLGKDASRLFTIEDIDDTIITRFFDFDLYAQQQFKDELFEKCPASLTRSHSAISATGTIVLWPTENEPRSLSLVPPLHFVIVDAKTIYPDFSSLIKKQNWKDKLPTNVVLVSGPSKTADIQQTLAYGAHGPKEFIVLLTNT